jgi:D-lactate dehydrogenase (cytochrome)
MGMAVATDLTPYLEDAAHYPGGHAAGIVFPRTIEEVVEAVESAETVLPIGAQSSLTGGATPMGETIVSTARMNGVIEETASSITVQPGITIAEIQRRLAQRGASFPPAPTFIGACAGGVVATNAAGAATFKYGSTRDWVLSLTVVLADGSVVRLRRGENFATGRDLEMAGRHLTVPSYVMPRVAKRSTGYFAAPGMDAIDLFIGSEGTLGIIVEITFRVLAPAPRTALAFVPCRSEQQGIRVAGALRDASMHTRRTHDELGIDAAAIEDIDGRCIEMLREDGVDGRHGVTFPGDTAMALFVHLELPPGLDSGEAYEQIAAATGEGAQDSALRRFCRILAHENLFDTTELALPDDRRRHEQLIAVREAVPAGVNARVGRAKHTIDERIAKTAADMVVPFERFAEMIAIYREGFERRGLDYAIWGHISDGNVHPNVIPRSYADVERGYDAILEFGRDVARLDGCPLAEHGVGRNQVKQQLLRQLYGDEGIDEMRAVKRALDPHWKLSPGVILRQR